MNLKGAKILMLIATLLTTIYGCKREDIFAPPTIQITPTELIIDVQPGEVVNFSANMEAEAGITNFQITESIDGNEPSTIFDSVISGSNLANVVYTYAMPTVKQVGERRLVFKVTDTEGNVGNTARSLSVVGVDSLLTEEKNLEIYSEKSGKNNGYLIQTNVITSPDSTFLDDIDILCADTTDTLTTSWSSPIGNEFVVFNGFNYDSATYRTMVDAYELGNPRKNLVNIKSGDIIITKLASPSLYEYALIKIVSVNDEIGAENDRYVFSIKK